MDELRGPLDALFILGAARVERLQVEPAGHAVAGVQGDGYGIGRRADHLHVRRSQGGHRARPTLTGVCDLVRFDARGESKL